MKQPRYRLTPRAGDVNIEGFLSGTMVGATRRIELVFYTPDHAVADKQYDALLELLREQGWRIRLQE